MCGIAGIFNLQGLETPQVASLHKMTNQMIHRGPDDEGFLLVDKDGGLRTYLGDSTPVSRSGTAEIPGYPVDHIETASENTSQVALGHRRLSIVDLSPFGHQPMSTRDKRYWVVFNGEIYNYREIAKELADKGVQLFSSSDTEVLLNAYAIWGEGCLKKFNGMFAFAIWDNKKRSLFCARDRIGIKPFYYTIQNGQFIFASDIKTLIASGYYQPEPDMEGLYLAMAFGMAPRPKTAFKAVAALEQAHWMRVSLDGSIDKERYWHIPIGTQKYSITESEAVELLEEQLTASIERRLVADVPVGTFMSGGIDSTTVSAIAAKLHPGIKAFTLGYEDTAPELDEVPQAMATARMHSMEHIVHRVNPSNSLVDLSVWVDCYEEPFHGLAANHVISKIVKENNVKVILNGLGGDELFAGYGWYRHILTWRILRALGPLANTLALCAGSRSGRIRSISMAKSADRLHTALFAQVGDEKLKQLFAGPELQEMNSIDYLHDMYVGDLEFTDEIEALSYMDLMNYIGNHHVHRIDQFTMAHSIEGRFPFLDHKFVESAFMIPSHLKKRGNVQKYVLRKMAAKYIAPECLTMKKKGFSLPLKQWMGSQLSPLIERELLYLKGIDFINADTVSRWTECYKVGKEKPQQIWHLTALAMWHKRFIAEGGI